MGPTIRNQRVILRVFLLFALSFHVGYAQTRGPLFCTALATPATVRAEGIAERMGDIQLSCSGGTPGTVVTGNLSISLPAPITNRLTPGTPSDIQVTVNTGAGPVPVPFSAQLITPQTVSLNGVSFTSPASGSLTLRVSNLRASMTNVVAGTPVPANLALDGLSTLALSNNSVIVAVPLAGLLTSSSNTVIRCTVSPFPTTVNMTSLFAAGTHFESTRFTEGFASAFQPKGPLEDNGARFLVRYANIPAGVRLFVPDVVAGSDALQPTAGGDLGQPQAAGQYLPSSGTLVLARVPNADVNGAGGSPAFVPGPAGSAAVSLNSVSEVTLTNGSGFVVYEVMDASPTVLESAQFPLFVELVPPATPGNGQQAVSFAPVSIDFTANSTAPIPRFAAIQAGPDCQKLGDCSARYFPAMVVLLQQPLQFTAVAGGPVAQPPGYIAVQNPNAAHSVLTWMANLNYQSGSGWILLDPAFGVNNGTVRVFVYPQKLAPGTYTATITIDGGSLVGTKTIPVSLVVSAPPPAPPPPPAPVPPAPGIVSVTNSANFLPGPVVAGSLATIKGTKLSGKNVAVTFDGSAAQLLSVADAQIDLQVPPDLASKASAKVVVTVDGVSSPAQDVALANVAPAIFANGILNDDNTMNGPDNGALVDSVVQIFVTGVPGGITVLAKVHDREDLVPLYAGQAPGITGVQQVNVRIPADLPAMTTDVLVCGLDQSGQKVCSAPARITLADSN
jgi:uncharacterized protein (TIGR03437 family)